MTFYDILFEENGGFVTEINWGNSAHALKTMRYFVAQKSSD